MFVYDFEVYFTQKLSISFHTCLTARDGCFRVAATFVRFPRAARLFGFTMLFLWSSSFDFLPLSLPFLLFATIVERVLWRRFIVDILSSFFQLIDWSGNWENVRILRFGGIQWNPVFFESTSVKFSYHCSDYLCLMGDFRGNAFPCRSSPTLWKHERK